MHTHLAEPSIGKKLLQQTFWVYFFVALSIPVGYLVKALIANKLTLDEVGLYYSVLSFVSILAAVNDLGLTESIQYYLPKYRIEKKYNAYKTLSIIVLIIQLITGTVGVYLMYIYADRLSLHHFNDPRAVIVLQIFSRYFFGINLFQLITTYFGAFQNNFLAQGCAFLRQVLLLLAIGYFRWQTGSIDLGSVTHSTLYALFCSLIIAGGAFLFFYRQTYRGSQIELSKKLFTEQFTYAVGVLVAVNAGMLLGNIDQQFVIHFLGTESAGIYANYQVLLMIYSVLIGPLLTLIFPFITEFVTKKKREEYKLFQHLLYTYYLTLGIICAGIFGALGPEIAMMLFGTKFIQSGMLVSVMSPFLIFNIMLAVNFSFLAGLGQIKKRAIYLVYAFLINVIINVLNFFVFEGGLLGPVIGSILARLFLWGVSFFELHTQHHPITRDKSFIIKNVLLTLGLSTCIYLSKSSIFIESNAFRRQNITWFVGIVMAYCMIFAVVNRHKLHRLIRTIKSFRHTP